MVYVVLIIYDVRRDHLLEF